MNDNSSGRKMSFMQFHSVNAKGNWANSAEKNLQPGAKITTVFRLKIMKMFKSYRHKNILMKSVVP